MSPVGCYKDSWPVLLFWSSYSQIFMILLRSIFCGETRRPPATALPLQWPLSVGCSLIISLSTSGKHTAGPPTQRHNIIVAWWGRWRVQARNNWGGREDGASPSAVSSAVNRSFDLLLRSSDYATSVFWCHGSILSMSHRPDLEHASSQSHWTRN